MKLQQMKFQEEIARDFSISLSITDRINSQKIKNKKI